MLLSHKRNKIIPFAGTQMDLEIIILRKCMYICIIILRERQIYNITYMWNLKKNDTNELIFKTKTDSQTQRTNLWLPRERGVGG